MIQHVTINLSLKRNTQRDFEVDIFRNRGKIALKKYGESDSMRSTTAAANQSQQYYFQTVRVNESMS